MTKKTLKIGILSVVAGSALWLTGCGPAYSTDSCRAAVVEDAATDAVVNVPDKRYSFSRMRTPVHPALLIAVGILAGFVATVLYAQSGRYVVINSSPQVIKLDHWTGRTYTLAPFPGAQWQEVRNK